MQSGLSDSQQTDAASEARHAGYWASVPTVLSWRSVSGRLLWLVLAIVVFIEILIFVPELATVRSHWLQSRVSMAEIAALSVVETAAAESDSGGRRMDRDDVLRLSGIEAIEFREGGFSFSVFDRIGQRSPDARIYLLTEGRFTQIKEALRILIGRDEDRLVEIVGGLWLPTGSQLRLIVDERVLTEDMRGCAAKFLGASLLLACLAAGLLYVALLLLLVRPIRRITSSIVAFRVDPEHAAPLDAAQVSLFANDEMAFAGRELSAMQQELRAALCRKARLAALGTAVAKVSHDLRGILTVALLSAERLQLHTDAMVRRTGETLVEAVDRAIDLVRGTLEFAREGPSAVALKQVGLRRLVDETARNLLATGISMRIENHLDAMVAVDADRNQLMRVLANLLRNSAEAGAGWASVSLGPPQGKGLVCIDIADKGPGLPDVTRANLFRPFVVSSRRGGSGLGLAISRDLMRDHGGDIALVNTGPDGTVFRLTLLDKGRIVGGRASGFEGARD